MSTIMRTLRNMRRVGIKDALHQMHTIKTTNSARKEHPAPPQSYLALTYMASHRCQIEPGWHAWISYMVDKPPTEDPLLHTKVRPWELPDHRPTFTMSRAAFKTYST
ncbi:hypothetical protein NHQ30_004729 [Ciborinia camelliae]|nr:hypothetical protein NHQ30_004729 [Ciborinia camelliae]